MITQRRSNGGADPKCTFLVEAKPGYYFTDEVNRPAIVEKVDPESIGTHDRYHGVHGYGPTQANYFTTAIFAVSKSKVVRLLNMLAWLTKDRHLLNY